MTEDATLTRILDSLRKAREPWSPINHAETRRSLLDAGLVRAGRITLPAGDVDFEMFALGSSNVMTLAAKGMRVSRADPGFKFEALRMAAAACWLTYENGWLWEAAAVKRPEELALILNRIDPTVPKNTWPERAAAMLFTRR